MLDKELVHVSYFPQAPARKQFWESQPLVEGAYGCASAFRKIGFPNVVLAFLLTLI